MGPASAGSLDVRRRVRRRVRRWVAGGSLRVAHFRPVTRGPIPRFDLYEELEVSRLASVEVIVAAYRSLVKRHHPDVARSKDLERIDRDLARVPARGPRPGEES